jgi:hypothetical protein
MGLYLIILPKKIERFSFMYILADLITAKLELIFALLQITKTK